MGACSSKPPRQNPYSIREDPANAHDYNPPETPPETPGNGDSSNNDSDTGKKYPVFPFYTPSPARFFSGKKSGSPAPPSPAAAAGSVNSTPRRFFKRPFPPPSPAKHIKAVLARRGGSVKPNNARAIPEGQESDGSGLDKRFGFSKQFAVRYEIEEEMGRGHFGYTCAARSKKGDHKGQQVAVKVIPKTKMTTAIAIEDVRREVKILRALTGHNNLVEYYDAFEDNDNALNHASPFVHYVFYHLYVLNFSSVKLCFISLRGGKYSEDEAKAIMVQILSVVAFCHLQGVVHRDLKPENFLFTSKDENSQLKAIDFGLSDFVRPDEKLSDIVGSAYYVAPEVLHRSYGTEADVWSVGVVAYILLCGSRPFWSRTESGIFRAVLKADLNFDEAPWPSLSLEAKDFVKRLLNKDPRKRMTAAQALGHPWIRTFNDIKAPLDILVFRLMKAYMRSSPLRKAALRALSKTLTEDDIFYLKEQFALLEPNKDGSITLENIRKALMKHATDAMKETCVPDFLASLNALQYRRMEFEEFCAAAFSIHQLQALDRWEQRARCAYEIFEKSGNRAIVIQELASELGLGPSVPVHAVVNDWVRHADGKLSFLGFVKLLHGVSTRSLARTP
ncbi:hypothetical protein RJ639_043724 [Escallonia herrerae]|uniref:non-specific serine/threonine protein kinase n=1 Tax=Escallonia herrerae TaxID=1293975 RepID=A0AA88WCM2_9ASTE|nr:hypothetical protein RJ639_043724 [Escallonia herrerae]